MLTEQMVAVLTVDEVHDYYDPCSGYGKYVPALALSRLESAALRERLEAAVKAIAKCVPIIREERKTIVECNTYPVGDESSLKDGALDDVRRIDEALALARVALAGGEA